MRPAFDGQCREELLTRVTTQEPVPPRRINRAIPADLETIILKAMAKEPPDRYTDAAELAEDLQRFLDSRPIRAKKPGLMERANKWSRRHKQVVAFGLVVLLLAVLGLAVSNILVVRERSKTRQAYEEVARKQSETAAALADEAEQRTLAERSFRQAREMLDSFVQASIEDLAVSEGDRGHPPGRLAGQPAVLSTLHRTDSRQPAPADGIGGQSSARRQDSGRDRIDTGGPRRVGILPGNAGTVGP